jgi:hypothetical protein
VNLYQPEQVGVNRCGWLKQFKAVIRLNFGPAWLLHRATATKSDLSFLFSFLNYWLLCEWNFCFDVVNFVCSNCMINFKYSSALKPSLFY